MSAYYNEIDPYAAQWLRNLIKAGHIADGEVDERSIEDVRPDDLRGFTQCHFFAGIGVWNHAFRRAGWDDSTPVWTGSCPCQPFSTAGKGDGFTDERHLWPHFHYLISECRPPVVFGEQVAGKSGLTWLDLVQTDLENTDYATAAFNLSACGFGAPHIRQRLFWVADTTGFRLRKRSESATSQEGWEQGCDETGQLEKRFEGCALSDVQQTTIYQADQKSGGGYWSESDWIHCDDGRKRPTRPGAFPLVNGATQRVGRLRAYGNAINAEVATQFIKAYMECIQ